MKSKGNYLSFKFILILVITLLIILIYCNKIISKKSIMYKKVDQISTLTNNGAELNKTQTISLSDNVNMEFVLINPGSFMMGEDEGVGDSDESPKHKVTITQPFYLGKYEVTQEQWMTIMGNNPSTFKGKMNPVDTVSWEDCQIFIQKLSEKTGQKFSLPTEAQWEFACRAGTTTPWSFGENEDIAGDYAWINENSNKTTNPVGSKEPNAWGIYDMYGNIQEWCADWYTNKYQIENSTDPIGPSSGDSRIVRGGGWGENTIDIRSSYRNCNGPDGKNDGIGFRCVMVAK